MTTVLSGDSYLIQLRKRALIDEFLQNNNIHNAEAVDMALEEIDLAEADIELADLDRILQTDSLFSSCKLVILDNLSSRADLRDQLDSLCELATGNTSLVILEPSNRSPEVATTGKTSFLRSLQQVADKVETCQIAPAELPNWLRQRAEFYQSTLALQTARYLIAKVGTDPALLNSEVHKLSAHSAITEALIDDLVPDAGNRIFKLLDSLLAGQLQVALALYDHQKRQDQNPRLILGALIGQLRVFVVAKTTSKSVAEVAKEFGIHQFPLQKARQATRHMRLPALQRLIDLCLQADRRIRVDYVDPHEALLFLITEGCTVIRQR